jgi:hypothetical protein
MRNEAMDESKVRTPQPDSWLNSMIDLLGDEQLVDLALGVGREKNSASESSLKEQEHIRTIKAELLYRLQNSRQVRITMRD